VNRESDLILLVEDNESHALLVKRALLESEFKSNIVHVCDGEEALDFLYCRNNFSSGDSDSRAHPRPKIILLDLRLPRMDGLEVLRTVKTSEEFHDIPVVILTSSMAEPDVVGAYYFHANSYLVKPADFALFRRQILDTVNYWLKWNITPLL
jgi:CheY-like chemotaxis protein